MEPTLHLVLRHHVVYRIFCGIRITCIVQLHAMTINFDLPLAVRQRALTLGQVGEQWVESLPSKGVN